MADDSAAGSVDTVTPHAVAEVKLGRDTAEEAIEFRVGPPCNWTVFYPEPYYNSHVALWGDHLEVEHLRLLADACNELEREASDMSMYEEAKQASTAAKGFTDADMWGLADA